MEQEKILKIIRGLNTFSPDDILMMCDVDEDELEIVLQELTEKNIIIKIGDDEYTKVEKIRKRPSCKSSKGAIGFKTASKNFLIEAEHKCTKQTFKTYQSAVNKHLLPFFEEYRIAKIKPENIDEFILLKMDEELSKKTIDNILKLLGVIFEKALKDRYVNFNPVRAVKRF